MPILPPLDDTTRHAMTTADRQDISNPVNTIQCCPSIHPALGEVYRVKWERNTLPCFFNNFIRKKLFDKLIATFNNLKLSYLT